MFVLKGILRAETQEKILLYLLFREKAYTSEISNFFKIPNTPVQKMLARLEQDGVIVGTKGVGRSRIFAFNPRYAFLKPLKALLTDAAKVYPETLIKELAITRNRPRAQGKTVSYERPLR